MTVFFLILILAILSAAGFYVMDHSGEFMDEHYHGSVDRPVSKKKKQETFCGTILQRLHMPKKG